MFRVEEQTRIHDFPFEGVRLCSMEHIQEICSVREVHARRDVFLVFPIAAVCRNDTGNL